MAHKCGSAQSDAGPAKACSRTGSGNREAEVTLKRASTADKSGRCGSNGGPWKTERALVRGQARCHDVVNVFVQSIPLMQGIFGSINGLEKFDKDLARVNDQ